MLITFSTVSEPVNHVLPMGLIPVENTPYGIRSVLPGYYEIFNKDAKDFPFLTFCSFLYFLALAIVPFLIKFGNGEKYIWVFCIAMETLFFGPLLAYSYCCGFNSWSPWLFIFGMLAAFIILLFSAECCAC